MGVGRANDIRGQRFSKLIVLERADDCVRSNGKHSVRWKCKCDCGNIVIVRPDALRRGTTKSCGCYIRELQQKKCEESLEDLTGQRFGRWLVLCYNKELSEEKNHLTHWVCKCDCGTIKSVARVDLVRGKSKSCGCYRKEFLSEYLKGENSCNWQGGVTSLCAQIRNSQKYKEWRTEVYKKDRYVCQVTGEKGRGDLQVHHIKPFHQILEENDITTLQEAHKCDELWGIDNGVTISEEWHLGIQTENNRAFHKLYGMVSCSSNQFYDWFSNVTVTEGRNYG